MRRSFDEELGWMWANAKKLGLDVLMHIRQDGRVELRTYTSDGHPRGGWVHADLLKGGPLRTPGECLVDMLSGDRFK